MTHFPDKSDHHQILHNKLLILTKGNGDSRRTDGHKVHTKCISLSLVTKKKERQNTNQECSEKVKVMLMSDSIY